MGDTNGNNGSNNSSTMSSSEKAARLTEEVDMVRRFLHAAENKLNQIQARGDAATFSLEPAELQALLAINNHGLLEGAAAGVVSFIVLRRVRSSWLARLQRQTTTSGTPSAPGHHSPKKSPFQQLKPVDHNSSKVDPASVTSSISTIPEQVSNRRSTGASGAAYNLITWMIDATVGLYIAVYVSVRNPDKLLHQVADLPLVAGQSRLATELCPVFLAELQNLQRERRHGNDNNFDDGALQNPQTPLLRAFLRVCHNCQQRAAYEKLLRHQQGLRPDEAVTIPLPGVPHNVVPKGEMLLSNDAAWGSDDHDHHMSEFFDADTATSNRMNDGSGDDWSESLVQDQEEQSRRETQRRERK